MSYANFLSNKSCKQLIRWYDNGGHVYISHTDLKKIIKKMARDAK